MRLLRLTIENFMAYEAVDLDFAGVSQVAVTGHNNSGKSALLDALEWCLWGRVGRDIDQRSADKFIRRGTDLMRVSAIFEANGRDVWVTREKPLGKTGTLALTVDGVNQRGHVMGRKDAEATLDQSQARIDALIGLGFDAITAGPFMAQEQASYFMRASPRDRKDLLIRLLGVDRYQPLHEEAQKAVIEAETAARLASERLTTAESVAADGAWVRGAIRERETDRRDAQAEVEERQRTLLDLRERYAAAAERAARHTAADERLLRAVERRAQLESTATSTVHALAEARGRAGAPAPTATVVEYVPPEDIAAAEQRMREAQEDVSHLLALEAQQRSVAADLARAERASYIATQVPCGARGKYAACQFLVDVPTEAALAEARSALDTADVALASKPARAQAAARAFDEWRTLVARQHALEAEAREQAHQHALWETTVDSARGEVGRYETLLAQQERAVEEAVTEVGAAEHELAQLGEAPDTEALKVAGQKALDAFNEARAARDTAASALEPLRARLAAVETAEAEVEAQRAKVGEAEAKAATMRLLAKAWHRDGIPTAIIETAVPLLEARANAVLARMPEDLAVALRTQRPTKTGGMAETLDVVVTIDGWESDYGLLSVGARFRVDLALRLALADLLTSRSGATIETLWLDEPLAALDPEGREAVVTTLTALSDEFGLIVVVSHHDDLNDVWPARIRVSKEDGMATAVLET